MCWSGRGQTLYQISDYLIAPQVCSINNAEAVKWFSASNSPTRYFWQCYDNILKFLDNYSKQFLFCHNQHLEITLIKHCVFPFSVVIFESLKYHNIQIIYVKTKMLKEILYIIFCDVKKIKYN